MIFEIKKTKQHNFMETLKKTGPDSFVLNALEKSGH